MTYTSEADILQAFRAYCYEGWNYLNDDERQILITIKESIPDSIDDLMEDEEIL